MCLREQFYDMSSNVAYGQTWETLNWISWLQSQIVSQRRGARRSGMEREKILWYFPTFSPAAYCRSAAALKQNRSVLTRILGDTQQQRKRGESDLNGHNLPSFTQLVRMATSSSSRTVLWLVQTLTIIAVCPMLVQQGGKRIEFPMRPSMHTQSARCSWTLCSFVSSHVYISVLLCLTCLLL